MQYSESQRGIGRGEVAESRIEAPFVMVFMLFCAVILLVIHAYFQNVSVTIALSVSMLVLGITIVRVEIGIYILVAAMMLSPEIDMGTNASGERSLNVRYDDVLILVIFLGVLVKLAFEGKERFWRPCPINSGIVAYYLICIVSSLMAMQMNLASWDRRDAFFVLLKMMEFYMVFLLVGNAVRDMRDVRRQLIFFFLIAMFICLYCVGSIGRVERIGTPFEAQGSEPNTLGGYLVVVMCVAIGLFTQAPKRWMALMFLGMAGCAFAPFLFTLSRASYLGFIAATIAMGILTRKYFIILTVAVVLFLSPVLMPTEVKDRVNYTFQRGTGEPVVIAGKQLGVQVDKSTYERLYVWDKVKYTLGVAPWFGGGISWGKVLDSQYARVIMETGLCGLCAFIFLQFRICRTLSEAYRWSRNWMGRGISVGLLAATFGLITHSLGTISFLIIRIMEPYWFLVALAVVTRAIAIDEHAARQRAYYAAQAKRRVVLQSQEPVEAGSAV
jgi:O-antigen ligase